MKELKKAKEICPTTTLGKIKEGALMVDVRNHDEVNELSYDVPNYINIPLGELEDRINEIPKNGDIVMVCRSGGRSLRATYFLMNAGYIQVFNMEGGILKWASKGFPTIGDVDAFLGGSDCCSKPGCC